MQGGFWKFVMVAALTVLAASPAWAWGRDGHRIVCAVAWDELTPTAKAKIADMIHAENRDAFAESCIWADNYSFFHKETGPWHYVNVPPDATSVDLARDCPNGVCVVAKIETEIRVLRDRSTAEPAATLRFLAHFISDVHQPMHVSLAADQGGNLFKGLYNGQPFNMHGLWDFGMLEHDGRPWREIANVLHARVTAQDRATLPKSKPIDWANESLGITRARTTSYIPHGDTFELDDPYTKLNLPILLDRMKEAGVRLAAVLNDLLK